MHRTLPLWLALHLLTLASCAQPGAKPGETKAIDQVSAMHSEECSEKSDCSRDSDGVIDRTEQRITKNHARLKEMVVPPSFGPCAEERASQVSGIIRESIERNEQQASRLSELRLTLDGLRPAMQRCEGSDEVVRFFEELNKLRELVYRDAARLFVHEDKVILDGLCCAKINIVNKLPASTSASPVGWVLDGWAYHLEEKLEPGQQRKVYCGKIVAGKHSFGVTIQGAIGENVTAIRPEKPWQFDCPAGKVVDVRMTVSLSSDEQAPLALRISVVGEVEVGEEEER